MKKIVLIALILGIMLIYLGSCKFDHGLGPIDEDTGISGTITYVGAWPEPGSIPYFSDVWLFGPIAHTHYIPKDSLTLWSVAELYQEYPQRFSYINYDSLYESLSATGKDLAAEFCTVKVGYEIAPIEPDLYKWIFFIAIPNTPSFPLDLDSLHFYVMATYYTYDDSVNPGQVEVEDERLAKDIDMTVNYDYFREVSGGSSRSYLTTNDGNKKREVRDDLYK